MNRGSWIKIAMGLLGMGVGLLPVLAVLGILPTRPPQPGDAPNWLGFAIGLAFFLGGLSVIVRTIVGADDQSGDLPATAPAALRAIYEIMGFTIAVSLAVILSWVAFGPGERQFAMGVGAGGATVVQHGSSQIAGRIAFGFGAALAWLLIGCMTAFRARRWLAPR